MSFSGYREDLRGKWLGYPVGLGYTLKNNKFTVYMIKQSEQDIIEITNEEQTKAFRYIPMATLSQESVKWLMDSNKSKLNVFHGLEEYENHLKEDFKKFTKEFKNN